MFTNNLKTIWFYSIKVKENRYIKLYKTFYFIFDLVYIYFIL